ncbi:MAG TPA: hypothetical protein VH186_06240 [Chloroflexia bacterium]|nr:hypothetical protein [Chloroflexia bacterium]
MSTFGYKSVKDQLVAVLQGVSSLKAIYGKEEKKLTQFPAACVSAKEHSEEYHSMNANKRQLQHIIRIYFRTDEANDPDYEDVLETVADEVIAALVHNITLNNSCDYSIPISGQWTYGEKETPTRVFEIIELSTGHVIR